MTGHTQMHTKEHKEVKSMHTDGKSRGGMEQLVYTPDNVAADQHAPTMVLWVDPTALSKWKSDKTIPMAQVVDSFEVLKYEMGRSGLLSKPSKAELHAVFDTSHPDDIVKFMLEQGTLHNKAM